MHVSSLVFLGVLLTVGANALAAGPVRSGHVEAGLLSEVTAVRPGRTFVVGLRLRPDEHWHTYWRNPGETGLATAIEWTLPPGFVAGDVRWPAPERIATGPVLSYGYEGEVVLLTEIAVPAGLQETGAPIVLRARANWLACSDQCVPGEADLSLELTVGDSPPDAAAGAIIEDARRRLPVAGDSAWPAAFTANGVQGTLDIGMPDGVSVEASSVYFFADDESIVDPVAPQTAVVRDGHLVVNFRMSEPLTGPPATLSGVLTARDGFPPALRGRAIAIAARHDPTMGAASGSSTLVGLVLSAFVGGLILNLMPCVFPVLGIKILGFVHQSGSDRRKVTLHGVVFAAGVLVSFWVLAGALLALRAGGEHLGWGFQLQSPLFVFGLAAFLLVFALNLSGVFEVGLSATGIGSSLQMRSGYSGSFFTGVLATVVSTPCAAPFLAPALGAALTLPPVQAFVLFTVIGLGLSVPYLVLSIFPGLVKMLPRPGAWMETFKQTMAFPLYGTVVFLAWVMAGQLEENAMLSALLGLVLVAMAAWAYGRWTQNGAGRIRRVAGFSVAAMLLAVGLGIGMPRISPHGVQWREWSPELVERLRADGEVVYVDFTARWCATCKVNKLAVFSSGDVLEEFERAGVVALKADWTRRNPDITAELERFGRSAVPFTLVYGPANAEPIVLPEVLTPGVVLDAIERVGRQTLDVCQESGRDSPGMVASVGR